MDRKKILLVDDEAAIRRMARAVLGEEFYEITEEGNGLDAQARLEKQKFDLIITDIIMPGCDGIDLAIDVRSKHPDTKIIIMSGRVRSAHYFDLAEKLGATRVVEKPFDTEAFRKVVHELLD